MYKDFLDKARLADAPVLMKAIAYELLLSTCKANKVPVDVIDMTDDVKKETVLLQILDLAESWSNDLMDIFVGYAKSEGVDTPIVTQQFKWIWEYLGI